MCPVAAGGGGLGQKPRFLPETALGRAGARIQRFIEAARMSLATYHRLYELAWDGDPESSRRFRRILRILLVIVAILGVLFPLLPTPQPTAVETEVPPQ